MSMDPNCNLNKHPYLTRIGIVAGTTGTVLLAAKGIGAAVNAFTSKGTQQAANLIGSRVKLPGF